MIAKRKTVSGEAATKHAVDVALAGQFDDLLAEARADEDALRSAHTDALPFNPTLLLTYVLKRVLEEFQSEMAMAMMGSMPGQQRAS